MANEHDPRQATTALLRQLSIGLSAYRLFPGDLEQQSFVGAVERIRAAAEKALGHGTVIVEAHGSHFRTKENEQLPDDETLARLALACFERRGERLRVRALPEAKELAVFYDALTQPPEEVEEAGGLDKVLKDAGVSSIAVAEVELQPMDSSVLEGLTAEQAQLWEQLQHGEALAPMLDESEDGREKEEAGALYTRFKDLVSSLPSELADDPDLYRRLHASVEELPPGVRQGLLSRMLETARDETMADRMLGTMTDREMAKALVELADESKRDPVALARDIVTKGIRRNDTIVKMTSALVEQAAPRGAPAPTAAAEESASVTEERSKRAVVSQAVSDMLSREVHTLERADLDAIRLEFPLSQTEYRAIALATLRDYVTQEHDIDRLETVLEIWSIGVRERLQEADAAGAAELVELVQSALADDEERAALAQTYLRRVLDAELVASLLTGDHEPAALRTLLEPLGPTAVDGLLDVLADEQNRIRRALLIAILVELSRNHRSLVVARLDDPRWYVVRNAITILHRAGLQREDLPWLERTSRHEHPAVRRESIEAITAALGADAVPHLHRLAWDSEQTVADLAVSTLGSLVSQRAVTTLVEVARGSTDWNVRRGALEALGRQSAPGALEALRTLGSWRSQPRLPRSLRRAAKKLAKERAREQERKER